MIFPFEDHGLIERVGKLHNCLKQARLERVCELLVTTLMPLSEIAEQTGFNTSSYLCSAFREYCGQSPQDYRKLYPQMERCGCQKSFEAVSPAEIAEL